jgi:hypothetical protein
MWFADYGGDWIRLTRYPVKASIESKRKISPIPTEEDLSISPQENKCRTQYKETVEE